MRRMTSLRDIKGNEKPDEDDKLLRFLRDLSEEEKTGLIQDLLQTKETELGSGEESGGECSDAALGKEANGR